MNRPGWTLVVLAAGLGRRFGGAKQLVSVGPAGELLSDYTLYDALAAGASRAVYVVTPGLEPELRRHHERWRDRIEIRYARQQSNNLPPGRAKPWGTTEAVLVTRDQVNGSCVVVNADDFYGPEAITAAATTLSARPPARHPAAAAIAFRLGETLSPSGPVSRAVLEVDAGGWLRTITERSDLTDASGLAPDQAVSMNCWAFGPRIFPLLQQDFSRFLATHGRSPIAECALPETIGRLISAGALRVQVVSAGRGWLGMTHRDDLSVVRAALAGLVDKGVYSSPLPGP